ncbi:26501_t:CDS:2 [Dentiscutata erythropus]|uniref:26501_t:CDS:1 n=1 Tax=Dentiscutata erythropus TaxID=1348616 RepID=A0A9N8V8F3_9GLOM|nr:26501_t:CDS:2 [Dentiscutata erythropus]
MILLFGSVEVVAVVVVIILFIALIKHIDEGTLEDQKRKIFFFPQYNNTTHQFECTNVNLDNTVLQDKSSNTTILQQIAEFGAILGLLFNVAVYGVTSKLSFKNTCIVDDLLILTCFLVPIISWFFLTKSVYVFAYDHNYPDKLAWVIALFAIALLVTFLFVCYVVCCFHNISIFPLKSLKSSLFNHDFYDKLKGFIIWISFFNSILIAIFDLTEELIHNDRNYPDPEKRDLPFINALINFDFLSSLTDFFYFFSSFWLLISYYQHKPFCLTIKNPLGEPQPKHFIRKRLFFFVIFISIIECFFEYNGNCTPKVTNSIFFFILTTVITRSIASFFSNDKNFRVELIAKYGDRFKNPKLYNFVFLRIRDTTQVIDFLGEQRLYLQVDLDINDEELKIIEDIQRLYLKKPHERSDEFKEVYENIRQIINNHDYINGKFSEEKLFGNIKSDSNLIIKEIIHDKLKNAKDKTILDDDYHWLCNNHIHGVRFMADKLMKNSVGVYINVLETGILQYLTYSHRSVANTNSRNIKIEKDDSDYKIIIREGRIKWIVIPAISELEDFSIDDCLMVKEINDRNIENYNDHQINYLKHLLFIENLLSKKSLD